jgi:hypothetical protein
MQLWLAALVGLVIPTIAVAQSMCIGTKVGPPTRTRANSLQQLEELTS